MRRDTTLVILVLTPNTRVINYSITAESAAAGSADVAAAGSADVAAAGSADVAAAVAAAGSAELSS